MRVNESNKGISIATLETLERKSEVEIFSHS